MDLSEFKETLSADQPPAGLSRALAALWHAAKGDWDGAHDLAQQGSGADSAWVHAYLHRVEGDLANAAYWYRRAAEDVCQGGLADEWDAIAAALLEKT